MPIYAYKCESCGFAKDVLQKISDTPLTECPSCGAQTYRKQLTAAGFQLKGSGWYVTDFRDGGKGGAAAKSDDKPADSGASKTDTATPAAKPAEKSAPAPAAEAAPKKAAPTPSTGSDN